VSKWSIRELLLYVPQKAISERHSEISERHSAISERHSAISERHSEISERHSAAIFEHYSAISERHSAISERHSAATFERHSEAISERHSAATFEQSPSDTQQQSPSTTQQSPSDTQQSSITIQLFVEKLEWEGKGLNRRDREFKAAAYHPEKIRKRFAKFEKDGVVLISYRFHSKLSPHVATIVEAAKLAAIGPWNMTNTNYGERAEICEMGWSRDQLSIAGAYLINDAFEQYLKLSEDDFDVVKLSTGEDLEKNDEEKSIQLKLKPKMTLDELRTALEGFGEHSGSDFVEVSIDLPLIQSGKKRKNFDM